MGCFESKDATKQTSPTAPLVQPTQQQVTQKDATVAEAPIAADKVADVPKPKVEVTAQDKAYLKVKSLRDKVENFVFQSETLLKEDGLRALEHRRKGNMASAKIFLLRRELLKKRVAMQLENVERLSDMVDTMDNAKQNEKLFSSLEQGTKVINDLMKSMSPERIESVLDESRDAKDRVKEVSEMFGAEVGEELSDADFEMEIAKLEGEYGGEEAVLSATEQSALEKAANIPDVPSEIPPPPVSNVTVDAETPVQEPQAA